MKLCFLGQQSWMISSYQETILIDPVLTETFGTSSEVRFRVYPPRVIDMELLPKVSAVILTNEHLDHFHLPSLLLLTKDIPIYVGELTPDCVTHQLVKQGFSVHKVANGQTINLSELLVTFYLGSSECEFWEKRAYQVLIAEKCHDKDCIFIQSDTLISDDLKQAVSSGKVKPPNTFICTNNSQILPKGHFGAFHNLIPYDESDASSFDLLNMLNEMLIAIPNNLSPHVDYCFLNGSGYIVNSDDAVPFLLTNTEEFDALITELSMDTVIQSPLPGKTFDLATGETHSAKWVTLRENLWKQYKSNSFNQPSEKLLAPCALFGSYATNEEISQDLILLEKELAFMARVLLYSDFGQRINQTHHYLDQKVGDERFVFYFVVDETKALQYTLSLTRAAFIKFAAVPLNELIRTVPFGVITYLKDFCKILKGEFQIWELAVTNMRQWYATNKFNSPVCFLYRYFAEQVRQDLAEKVYECLETQ